MKNEEIAKNVAILILLELTLQLYNRVHICAIMHVAILILLELTLQLKTGQTSNLILKSRNPYFIGINSAINMNKNNYLEGFSSQSLFYWN